MRAHLSELWPCMWRSLSQKNKLVFYAMREHNCFFSCCRVRKRFRALWCYCQSSVHMGDVNLEGFLSGGFLQERAFCQQAHKDSNQKVLFGRKPPLSQRKKCTIKCLRSQHNKTAWLRGPLPHWLGLGYLFFFHFSNCFHCSIGSAWLCKQKVQAVVWVQFTKRLLHVYHYKK